MAIATHICHRHGGERAPRSVDKVLVALARRQHGVVTRAQLSAAGVGRRAIDRRIEWQLLQPLHRGVYAVGHRALRREAWWMAAVLAGGPGAALSYRSAAELWGMLNGARAHIDVSGPRHRRSTPRLRFHCVAMQVDEVTEHAGIAVTTPARTLLDLAAVVSPEHLKAAFEEAEVRRRTSPTSLDALLERYPRRKGTAAIRKILEQHDKNGRSVPTSLLERRFLALLDAHDIPRPTINRLSSEGELDATWPEQRLVVECDGFAVHGTREAFERDRAKDRALQVAGWRVVRLTWRQITDDPDIVAAHVKALLALG
jgi:hypothetical protein